MAFYEANNSGPHGIATAYVAVVGGDMAKLTRRQGGRWWLTFRGQVQRLGRTASFPTAQRAIEAML